MNNIEKGAIGENIACDYLKKNYYTIISKNYRNRSGEIDIIALDKTTLVFIEVKSRFNFSFGTPAEAVTSQKKLHIIKVANYFLYLNPHIHYSSIRFDVIEVYLSSTFTLRHLKNAF